MKQTQHQVRMRKFAEVCARVGGTSVKEAMSYLRGIEKAQGYPMRLKDN